MKIPYNLRTVMLNSRTTVREPERYHASRIPVVVLTDLFFPVGRSRTDQMGWSAHFGRPLLFLYFLKLRYNDFQNIRKLSTMNPDPGLATSDMSEVCIILVLEVLMIVHVGPLFEWW